MNLSIARRLQIMIVSAIVALIVLAVSGAQVASNLRNGVTYIYTNTLPSVATIAEINDNFVQLRLLMVYHIALQDPAKKVGLESQITAQKEKILQGLARYEKELLSDAKDKELLEIDRKFFATYFIDTQPVLELSRANDSEGTWAAIAKANANLTQLSAALGAHKKYNDQLAEEFYKASETSDRQGRYIALTLIIASIVGVGGIGFFLLRGINKALQSTQGAITHIESNLDFTRRVEVHGKDELGTTAEAINRLLDKMQGNLKSIAQSAVAVALASNRMASTSEQMAGASSQQSSAASDMSATVEEMTVSINHVGERAAETNVLAIESGKLAATGEKTIGQTVSDIGEIADTVREAATSIRELEEQGNKISAVITVIKEIADQTNLLALNAAIEAARAGEQGRGFAVVADEVRKLAERTGLSTEEIASTISSMQSTASHAAQSMQNAVGKVAQGVARANDASDAILQIGNGSRGAVGMVTEITNAICEQGAATNNIAIQVEKIAQMAEENSAASSESARAARELDSLAESMQKIVATYRL